MNNVSAPTAPESAQALLKGQAVTQNETHEGQHAVFVSL